jgi:hypothetical protein
LRLASSRSFSQVSLSFSLSTSDCISRSRSYSRRRLALYTWNSPDPAPADEPCTLATISGGGGSEPDVRDVEKLGSCTSLLGSLKSVSIWFACSACGVTARRFVGRLLRGSALVGTDSGPGSDIVTVVVLVGYATRVICAKWEVLRDYFLDTRLGMGFRCTIPYFLVVSLSDCLNVRLEQDEPVG